MGAIGDASALPVLEKFLTHHLSEISETCQIAVDLIKYEVECASATNSNSAAESDTKTSKISKLYASVDPAPPFELNTKDPIELEKKVEEYQTLLIDPNSSLFLRYRAMFSLRDMNSDTSAVAIAMGFKDTSSALFRHELAYVLGQMQRKVTIPHLTEVLRDEKEHKMVRISKFEVYTIYICIYVSIYYTLYVCKYVYVYRCHTVCIYMCVSVRCIITYSCLSVGAS